MWKEEETDDVAVALTKSASGLCIVPLTEFFKNYLEEQRLYITLAMAEVLLSIRVTSPRRLVYHCYYYAKCHVLKIRFFHVVVLKDGPALLRGV